MEKIEDLRDILTNAVIECCHRADCNLLEVTFDTLKWKWNSSLFSKPFVPINREIGHFLCNLGYSAIDMFMKDYEMGIMRNLPYTALGGQLFFSIECDPDKEGEEFVQGIALSCGIKADMAYSKICEIHEMGYEVGSNEKDKECVFKSFDR